MSAPDTTMAPERSSSSPSALLPLVLLAGIMLAKAMLVPPFGPDELAHFSYAVDVFNLGFPPDLERLVIYDVADGGGVIVESYLNHPPSFYYPFGLLAVALDLPQPTSLILMRLVNSALVVGAIGLAVLTLAERRPPGIAMFYAGMFASLPLLIFQAGYMSNDTLALVAGCLWFRGASRDLDDFRSNSAGLNWMLAAIAVAFIGKLTAALVVCLLVGVWAAALLRARILPRWNVWSAVLFVLTGLAAAPYLYFLVAYGTPAPKTTGHVALMLRVAEEMGRTESRLDAAAFAQEFFHWMALGWASNGHKVLLAVLPILMLSGVIVLWRMALSARPAVAEGAGTGARLMPLAVVLVFLVTLAVHFSAAFERHAQTGWGTGANLRYYIPLLPLFFAVIADFAAGLRGRLRGGFAGLWIALSLGVSLLPLFLAED